MQILALAALLWWQTGGTPRPADGVIEGQILSMDGTPAVALRVSAISLSDSRSTSATTIVGLSETDKSGHFKLQNLAPGRYHIMAGTLGFASYYPGVENEKKARIVVLAGGGAVSGIDFKLPRPAGLRVTGTVSGLSQGMPAGIVRAVLTAAGGGVSQNAFIQPDGTFEFPKILPGDYLAGLTIGITPLRMVSVRVDKKDVHINMKAPVLLGHVSVDDGNPLPLSISGGAGIQFVGGGGRGGPLGSQFAVNPLAPLQEPLSLVQLRWRRTGPASEKQPNGQVQGSAMVRADGYFAFEAAPGKYEITAQQMPMGYYLKEVRQNPETSQFDVTLTTTPQASDPKGVTLSGRIAGLVSGAVEPKGVRIQMTNSRGGFSPGAPQRVAEVPIGADGAFSVRGVPPGTISLNLIPNSPLQMRIDVADRDLTLELSVETSNAGAVTFPRTGTTPGL